jgi:hypothetical protein
MGIIINNGWKSGDWHLLLLDCYHEQPLGKSDGVYGLNLGMFGFTIGIMFHHGE